MPEMLLKYVKENNEIEYKIFGTQQHTMIQFTYWKTSTVALHANLRICNKPK